MMKPSIVVALIGCSILGTNANKSSPIGLCRDHELFLSCGGCQKTCDNPNPACPAVCHVGCFCPGDLVRGKDGVCMTLEECVWNLDDEPELTDNNNNSSSASNEQEQIRNKFRGKLKDEYNEDIPCAENEVYRECEPCGNRTCDNPDPVCSTLCESGCFCKGDLVWDEDGKCIRLEHCKSEREEQHISKKSARKIEYEEKKEILCAENEVYSECEPCGDRTCGNPIPICPAQCARGCFCKEGLVRDKGGKCIMLEQCKTNESLVVLKDEEQTSSKSEWEHKHGNNSVTICAENKVYRECEPCGNRTCDNPNPICPAQCARGCFCKEGMVQNKDGICIKLEQCKRDRRLAVLKEEEKTSYTTASEHKHDNNSVANCAENEVYRECETCGNRTCDNPNPICPAQCARGCFCKEGLVREKDGKCIKLDQCKSDNHEKEDCEDPNAEYSCRYPCEEFCSGVPCGTRASRCIVGCFCKSGFVKEDSNGKCVKPDKCITHKKYR